MPAKFQVSFTDTNSDPLKGLWFREEPRGLGAPVRFYYFHGDGNGLYRYGRIGYTNTNSYDYSTKGDSLTLNLRKTGESHTTKFRIEREQGQEWLILEDDPKEKGARYFKERQNISTDGVLLWRDEQLLAMAEQTSETFAASIINRQRRHMIFGDILERAKSIQAATESNINKLDGFMWIEATDFKTGGFGFAIYQFREAGIDGRGTGWFHQGDFNDWSTESLQFRRYQDQLEFAFELRPECSTTQFSLTTKDKKRYLSLVQDPRNFWHERTFQEMGKSF